MNSSNTLTVFGTPTGQIEVEHTKNGRQFARFKLVCDASYGYGERRVSKQSLFDVITWGDHAAELSQMTRTHTVHLLVHGRLEQQSWTDKYGDRKSRIELVTDRIGVSLDTPPQPRPADEVAAEQPF